MADFHFYQSNILTQDLYFYSSGQDTAILDTLWNFYDTCFAAFSMFPGHAFILKVTAGHPCLLLLLARRWLEQLHNLFVDRSIWLINTPSLL